MQREPQLIYSCDFPPSAFNDVRALCFVRLPDNLKSQLSYICSASWSLNGAGKAQSLLLSRTQQSQSLVLDNSRTVLNVCVC